MKRTIHLALAVGLLVVAGACGTKNPAGGSSTLTVPRPVTPAAGTTVVYTAQPITLTVQNAVTTGGGTLTYTFDVATDQAFSSKVTTKTNVAAGGSGQTSITLDVTLPGGRTYYWRAMATDGSGTAGPYSSVITFAVGPEITLKAPQPVSPAINETVGSTTPTFTITNATRTGPVGTIYYQFEISTTSAFASLLASGTVQEDSSGQTSWTCKTALPVDTQLYWHVKTTDPSHNISSSYTNTRAFKVMQGIDLTTVVYIKGPDISSWPQTSTITSVEQGGGLLCIYHTMLGVWPATQYLDTDATVEGNQWIFAYINGKWYGGAGDWYRPGQACKGQTAESMGHDNFYNASEEPLHSWVPQAGENVGYAASTPARLWPQMSTLDQRTNVVIVPWSN